MLKIFIWDFLAPSGSRGSLSRKTSWLRARPFKCQLVYCASGSGWQVTLHMAPCAPWTLEVFGGNEQRHLWTTIVCAKQWSFMKTHPCKLNTPTVVMQRGWFIDLHGIGFLAWSTLKGWQVLLTGRRPSTKMKIRKGKTILCNIFSSYQGRLPVWKRWKHFRFKCD